MDLATIIGIISGMVIFFWAISMGGSLGAFIDIPSALIVFGGVLAATMINYPFAKLLDVLKILKNVFKEKQLDAGEIIKNIVSLAETARREGLLALEEAAYQLKDEFLQKGILLIVDGTDPELVRNILETELAFLEERHKEGQSIFESMGALSPAFGLIGTIIGLINMLGHLDNPEAVGPGMAVALITTFYGAVFANLLFIPIAGKLKVRSREEILLKEVMIEGMLSIQAGENPRIIEEKLNAFLSPKKRYNFRKTKTAESGGEDLAWQQTTR
ncbi:MAG TPA: flagellar motor protein [Thermoanaerobacterales bacterium]|nr:flagellar motor protein [Thermoanaerobacterales bacterium]